MTKKDIDLWELNEAFASVVLRYMQALNVPHDKINVNGGAIAMFDVTGGGAISLEPGGQFELSGAPLDNVHQTAAELMAHLAQLREVAKPLGIGFLGIGM